jgi:hypothetical protein
MGVKRKEVYRHAIAFVANYADQRTNRQGWHGVVEELNGLPGESVWEFGRELAVVSPSPTQLAMSWD